MAKKKIPETSLDVTPKNEETIKRAFGQVLRNSGMRNIIRSMKDVDTLLDDGVLETFSFYMSHQRFSTVFVATLAEALVDQMQFEGWWNAELDRKTLVVPPNWEQTIKSYFNDTFKKGILNEKE